MDPVMGEEVNSEVDPAGEQPEPDVDSAAGGGLDEGGMSALRKERAAAKDARAALKEIEAAYASVSKERDELAAANLSEAEQAVEAARAEGAASVRESFTEKLVAAEIRSAASAVGVDPEIAEKLVDCEGLVSDDGTPNRGDIVAAVEGLVKKNPYLAARDTQRGIGIDQGNMGDPAGGQIPRSKLKSMSPADIEKARLSGRLNDVLGIKS